jgi:hypothetical protein
MAEPGESAPKTGELYLGIVDLFAVILPGAIITFVVEKGFALDSHYEWLRGAQGWAVFLATSYIVGHLVSAFGGMLLDKVYDTGYKLSKAHSGYFRIRIRARDVVKAALKSFYSEKDNAMEWAGIIARLGSAPASAEIDRLEADSKFFRSLTTVLILGWPTYLSIIAAWRSSFANIHGFSIRVLASSLGVLSLLSIGLLRYYVGREEDRHEVRKASMAKDGNPSSSSLEDRVAEDRESAQGLAIPCWRATLGTVGIWVVLVIVSGWLLAPALALVGAGCGVLTIFSGWRYMERRLKRTRLSYAYAIALSIQGFGSSVRSIPGTP